MHLRVNFDFAFLCSNPETSYSGPGPTAHNSPSITGMEHLTLTGRHLWEIHENAY